MDIITCNIINEIKSTKHDLWILISVEFLTTVQGHSFAILTTQVMLFLFNIQVV